MRRGWLLDIGLDAHEIVERRALLRGEVRADAIGVEGCLALVGGKASQAAVLTDDKAAAVRRETRNLRHRPADLLTLLWGEPFHRLCSSDDPLTAFRRHIVELSKSISHALLHLRGEIVEARLAFQGSLLLGKGHPAVLLHPLGNMFVVSLGPERRVRRGGRPAPLARLRQGGSTERSRQKSGERCALKPSGWEMRRHALTLNSLDGRCAAGKNR